MRLRAEVAALASIVVLGGCSALTAFGDLDFDSADSGSAIDLGTRPETGIPDAGSPSDSARDAGARDATTDAGTTPDAADMAIASPCGDCPPIRPCTSPACTTDGCTLAPLPAGAACDDADPCTEGTRCNDDGMCVGGASCPDDGDLCTRSVCTASGCDTMPMPNDSPCGPTADYVCCDGACVNLRAHDGHCGACGIECFGSGCIGGMCSAICDSPAVCLPPDPPHCVVATCSREAGCVLSVDAMYCLVDGACYGDGDANPDNPCLTCDVTRSQTSWSFAIAGSPCSDGLACTTDDACGEDGRCFGMEACTSGPCGIAICSEPLGACSVIPAVDGTPCNAGSGSCCEGTCRTAMGPCP